MSERGVTWTVKRTIRSTSGSTVYMATEQVKASSIGEAIERTAPPVELGTVVHIEANLGHQADYED